MQLDMKSVVLYPFFSPFSICAVPVPDSEVLCMKLSIWAAVSGASTRGPFSAWCWYTDLPSRV